KKARRQTGASGPKMHELNFDGYTQILTVDTTLAWWSESRLCSLARETSIGIPFIGIPSIGVLSIGIPSAGMHDASAE
ncbi:hypothetical protein, partial [Salinibacter ruber]|uniref:hypothetical protein n=1 Tax=Salinibacter ruber TaxID=146919 RepID=UPI00216772F4